VRLEGDDGRPCVIGRSSVLEMPDDFEVPEVDAVEAADGQSDGAYR
jgi:hypothetical protein